MSVGHASKELVSTSPSGAISTEGSDRGSIPMMSSPDSPGSVGRFSRHTPMEEAFFNTAISPRSQRGPMASIPFFTAPVSVATRFDPQCFRVFGAIFPCRLQLAGVASHLEVVADGLPLFHGAQLAIDTTMVMLHEGSVLDVTELRWTRRGEPKNSCIQNSLATRVGPVWRAGGGPEAAARARWEPPEIRQAARRAWFRRWCTALACCAAQAFALSLLERRGGRGVDGEVPSTCDVIWDDRRES